MAAVRPSSTRRPHGCRFDCFNCIRSGRAATRADLVQLTGLARSTVGAADRRADRRPASFGQAVSARPRAAGRRSRSRSILSAGRRARRRPRRDARADRRLRPRRELRSPKSPSSCRSPTVPTSSMAQLEEHFDGLLASGAQRAPTSARSASECLGPSSSPTGRPVNPPIMPGWDRFPSRTAYRGVGARPRRQRRQHHGAGQLDVAGHANNLVGEGRHRHRLRHRGQPDSRGAQGAAGDIGHICVAGTTTRLPLRQRGLPRGRRRRRRPRAPARPGSAVTYRIPAAWSASPCRRPRGAAARPRARPPPRRGTGGRVNLVNPAGSYRRRRRARRQAVSRASARPSTGGPCPSPPSTCGSCGSIAR